MIFPDDPHPASPPSPVPTGEGHPFRSGEDEQAARTVSANPKLRLKEQFHEVCRFKHLALRSEEAYWGWVVRLVRFFDSKVNPRDMNGMQLAEFLSHLASVGRVAASTQNQAFHPVR